LAEGLLGEGGGESGAPPYLAELFEEIFVDADRSNSGTLSTLQLMTMLKRRAKGIFTCVTMVSSFAKRII
jgi:hypothetical protein